MYRVFPVMLFVFVMSVFVFCLPAFADTVPYSTDFSTDPGWTTDQPSNYYWDSAGESYFMHAINTYPGYNPNRYAGRTLPQPVDSFELQWDVKVTQCDWSSGLYFGVWDSSLQGSSSQGGESIRAVIGRADQGRFFNFEVTANGSGVASSVYPGWLLDTQYTFKISYDSEVQVANLSVLETVSAQEIWNSTLLVPGGGFTRDLQFLGSNLGMVGMYGYSGLSSSAAINANIDNVQLVPEPATLSLLVLGGLAAMRKRRA